jgi:hypothetical protein
MSAFGTKRTLEEPRFRPTLGDRLLGRQPFGVTSAVHGGERAIASTAPTIESDWNQHKECG